MYLANIKLWNFRKFGSREETDYQSNPHLDLDLTSGLNVIIGENDSGKSAIIDAIKLTLKTHSYEYIRVDDKDFYEDKKRFRIELIFEGLIPDEAKNYIEWLAYNDGDSEPYLRIIYDVKRQVDRILPSEIKAGADEEGRLLPAEVKEYLKATYLKPLRDAGKELVAKRNSRLSQILLGNEAFKDREHDNDLIEIFEGLKKNLENYFTGVNSNGERINTEGKQIKDKIDEYIKSFYDRNSESEFQSTSIDIKSILEKLTLTLKGELNPGLGTLNRLFMAAELLHLTKSNWTGLKMGLVEELEAHLHPQAQMQVIEAFQKQKDIQLILTTHSPNLASKIKLKNLIICNNGKVFPMGKEYTKLDKNDYKFLEKFLDTTKANLFFAKGVIFVEGWAEELLIPSIAKAIGIDLTEEGVSIVNIGHTGFGHYSKIYLRENEPNMEIPVAVITDSDVKAYQKENKGGFIRRNMHDVKIETEEKIQEIKRKSEHNVKYFPAPNWTLEYSILKSNSLNGIFETTVKAIHPGMNSCDDFEKELAKKLLNGGLNKTDIAYKMAHEIDNDICQEARSIHISDDPDDTINYIIKAIKYATGN